MADPFLQRESKVQGRSLPTTNTCFNALFRSPSPASGNAMHTHVDPTTTLHLSLFIGKCGHDPHTLLASTRTVQLPPYSQNHAASLFRSHGVPPIALTRIPEHPTLPQLTASFIETSVLFEPRWIFDSRFLPKKEGRCDWIFSPTPGTNYIAKTNETREEKVCVV